MAPTPSAQRLRRGLPGYLILFAPHAFAPQRQLLPRDPPSPPVFLLISAHFTATPGIPVSPATLKSARIDCRPGVELRVFTARSEEHTSELQSRQYLVCRLLLEKKQILIQIINQII